MQIKRFALLYHALLQTALKEFSNMKLSDLGSQMVGGALGSVLGDDVGDKVGKALGKNSDQAISKLGRKFGGLFG